MNTSVKNEDTKENMMDAIEIIQDALIDLYLNVKVWTKDEIQNFHDGDLADEWDNLYQTSPIDLIGYIQTSVEILMKIKVDDYLASEKSKKWDGKGNKDWVGTEEWFDGFERTISTVTSKPPPDDYEEIIQKYEADIRNHIKVEQQMKLHSDSVIDKLEDKEKEYDQLEKQVLMI